GDVDARLLLVIGRRARLHRDAGCVFEVAPDALPLRGVALVVPRGPDGQRLAGEVAMRRAEVLERLPAEIAFADREGEVLGPHGRRRVDEDSHGGDARHKKSTHTIPPMRFWGD